MSAPRFRKERLDAVIAAAREAGARVRVDLVKGEAVIDFPAANDLSEADEEALRLEAAMKQQMAGR